MANDFKIILSSTVNTTQLKTDLDNFFKGYKAPPVSVGGSGTSGLGSTTYKTQKDDVDKLAQAEAKRAAKAIADQEKLNAAFAKYQTQVDVFLAKTQNRDLSLPGAQGALDVRNQMQTVLNGPVTPEAVAQLDKFNAAGKVADANFQGLNATLKNTGLNLLDVAKNMGLTISAMQLIQFALQQIGDGINYIKSLDKELTNTALVTGQSRDSLVELGKEYNNTAREMGVTTLEVAKGI